MTKKILSVLAVGCCLAFAAVSGQAEDKGYPNRQIDFIIPYDPGGSIDIMSRIFVEAIKSTLKVNVVPVNKPGAGGSIGLTYLTNAKPDGYMLSATTSWTDFRARTSWTLMRLT